MKLTVQIINQQPGQTVVSHVTLLQFERDNRRVYVQPAEGEPQRVDLAPGDSVIVTVEPK